MDWLEQELQQALRREDPPAGFAARLASEARRRPARFPAQRWLAAAAALLVIAGAGLGYRRHQGLVAREQVMFAVKFAAARVNRIQTQVREVTR
ncbi:MAG: hypothetical protein LAP87_28575 [Acidobacteriia bacterium]|nr:hypothetical protein [Terriglobia bacterium]